MSRRGEVLVAILKNRHDLHLATEQHWYRIPQQSVDRFLRPTWPPQWLAFYQPRAFLRDAYRVRYYARVLGIRQVQRQQLFPQEAPNPKSTTWYAQVLLDPLQQLPEPIISKHWRRLVFLPTTWDKLMQARDINDLYAGSAAEERLWEALKQQQIAAERHEWVTVRQRAYDLDFAIYCAHGKIDVETVGSQEGRRMPPGDSRRDNALVVAGWHILRFNAWQIQEEMRTYCLPTITATMDQLGGQLRSASAGDG